MTRTFKEVSKVETVDFCSLAAGAFFYYNRTYYMKLIASYVMNDECCYNAVDLESGVLRFFRSLTRVKPYKECDIILYE